MVNTILNLSASAGFKFSVDTNRSHHDPIPPKRPFTHLGARV